MKEYNIIYSMLKGMWLISIEYYSFYFFLRPDTTFTRSVIRPIFVSGTFDLFDLF